MLGTPVASLNMTPVAGTSTFRTDRPGDGGDADADKLAALVAITERCCVVYQTLAVPSRLSASATVLAGAGDPAAVGS